MFPRKHCGGMYSVFGAIFGAIGMWFAVTFATSDMPRPLPTSIEWAGVRMIIAAVPVGGLVGYILGRFYERDDSPWY